MSTLAKTRPETRALRVTFAKDTFTVHLNDGRALSVPYVYSARLAEASAKQRADYRLIGRGIGIHWPQVDEDLSVAGLLRG
jgi:hypothetical protein